jgi:hypothetical protein
MLQKKMTKKESTTIIILFSWYFISTVFIDGFFSLLFPLYIFLYYAITTENFLNKTNQIFCKHKYNQIGRPFRLYYNIYDIQDFADFKCEKCHKENVLSVSNVYFNNNAL